METNEEYKVNVELKNGNELIIRHGEAPEIDVPIQFIYEGNIDSPANFFEDRYKRKLLDTNTSHVSVDKRGLSIKLVVDEKNPKRTEIIGRLKKNPDLEAFGIWDKIYQHEELIKFLRKNRRFFEFKMECDKILKELTAFKYERNISAKLENDRKGNVQNNYQQTLSADISFEFTLSMPIYEGFEEKTFRVEIFPDITDGGIRFWLESPELIELENEEKEKIFSKEISRFDNILILYKN